jgi:hypothetical protein
MKPTSTRPDAKNLSPRALLLITALLLVSSAPLRADTVPGDPSCFSKKLVAVTEGSSHKEGEGVSVTTTLRCTVAQTHVDSLDRLYRYFEDDTTKNLRERAIGPIQVAIPTIGSTRVAQDHPEAIAYDIKPTGKDKRGKKEALFADGRVYLNRDRLPNGDERVSIAFMSSKLHCSSMFGKGPACLTRMINGRTDYIQNRTSGTISVVSINQIRVAMGDWAQKTIEGKGRETLIEKTKEVFSTLVGERIFPAQN